MKNVPILILISLLFAGCKTTLETYYGIRDPKFQTAGEISEYLRKHHQDPTKNYTFKDIGTFVKASENGLLEIPDAIFFDRLGRMVRYKEKGVGCNATVGSFIENLKDFGNLEPEASVKLGDITQLLKDGAKINPSETDVTVLITWTISSGRLNKKKAFDWATLIEQAKSKGLSVDYCLINCDLQKSWNLPAEAERKIEEKLRR